VIGNCESVTSFKQQQGTWTNWAGNQSFVAAETATPTSEDELIAVVQRATAAKRPIGIVGSSHSFSPIVETSDLLIKMEGVNGLLSHSPEALTADVLCGTTIEQMGGALWDVGLSMKNQGDSDAQTIAGAISTGTHGSGIEFGSLSSAVSGVRLITGTGEVLDIDATEPELLHAAQVSVGLLGVISRVRLDVKRAYYLKESNRIDPLDDVLDGLQDAIAKYRHYSFFWAPREDAGALYDLPYIPANHCYVKMLEETPFDMAADRELPISGDVGARTGRAYLIYPDTTDEISTWIELEYMVKAEDSVPAFLALRKLMQQQFPEETSPIEMRWTKGESALLSPHHGHDCCSISVSGLKATDWNRFLRAVDQTLRPWAPRSHWGKAGYLDHERLREVYPALDQFLAIRADLDPHGLFLNDHFRELLSL
jgi:FAD/FMN-containing dehydrogenase